MVDSASIGCLPCEPFQASKARSDRKGMAMNVTLYLFIMFAIVVFGILGMTAFDILTGKW